MDQCRSGGQGIEMLAIEAKGYRQQPRPREGKELTQNSIDLRGRVGTGAQPA